MARRFSVGKLGRFLGFFAAALAAMGHQGQPVRGLCGHRGHGAGDQRRRRHGAQPSRRTHGRSQRTGHPAPCGQPAAFRPEREPCQPGAGAARLRERGRAERPLREDERDPEGHDAEARRDRRARRRQGRGRRAHRYREEHRRRHREPRHRRQGKARHRRPARKAVRRPARHAGGLRRRREPGDDGRPVPDQRHPAIGQPVARRRRRGRPDHRPARQRLCQRQSGGLADDRRPFGQQQRHAGRDRKRIQGRPGARQVEPRSPAEERRQQGAERGGAEAAGAGRGQDRRLQASPEGTRRQRLRPDHPRRDPQAERRPRHQRAAARRRRAARDQRLDPRRRAARFPMPPS